MNYKIENGYLRVSVDSFASSLKSIRSNATGYEYLWQGNPEIWNGQSPILFPVIGGLLNNECVIGGKTYSIIRHGLARHYDFVLEESDESSLTFLQTENEQTLKSYPFKYELRVNFKIEENSLTVTHSVKNTNDTEMYFSLGAHPAFNCETGDEIVFECNENAVCERMSPDSLLSGEKELILDGENTITINEHLFDKDVMIFSDLNSKYVTLKRKKASKSIKFTFGDAPFFSIWAKPNAPFVCLEPWYGINDSHERVNSFKEKRGNVTLPAGESFSFSWKAEFLEK